MKQFASLSLCIVLLCTASLAQTQSKDVLPELEPINLENAETIQPIQSFENEVSHAFAWSPNGNLLAIGGENSVALYDTHNFSYMKSFGSGTTYSIVFSPDSSILAVSALLPNGIGGAINLYNVDTGQSTKIESEWLIDPANQLIFSVEGTYLIAGDSNDRSSECGGNIFVWNLNPSPELESVDTFRWCTGNLELSHQGVFIYAVYNDCSWCTYEQQATAWVLRDSETLFDVYTLGNIDLEAENNAFSDEVDSVAFSPDGNVVASGARTGEIKLWDVQTGQNYAVLSGHKSGIHKLVFNSSGEILVSSSGNTIYERRNLNKDTSTKFWNVGTGEEIPTAINSTDVIQDLAFSPDGKILALLNSARQLSLWGISAQ